MTKHLRTITRAFLLRGLDLHELAVKLWQGVQVESLAIEDLSPLPPQGASEHLVGALRLRLIHAPELFGLEVTDLEVGRIWEIGLARTGGDATAAFWRCVDCDLDGQAPQLWQQVLQPLEPRPFSPRTPSSFGALWSAWQSSGGVTIVQDYQSVAALEADVEYWRDLARAQARILKERPGNGVPAQLVQAGKGLIGEADAAPAGAATKWRLEDVGRWAAENSDRIVVLPRAIAACRKSEYAEPQHLLDALELLAGLYRLEKTNRAPRGSIKARVDALGMEIGGSVDRGHATEDYIVRWRGRRRWLDQHLKKGGSRDPRFCLRVYFTWDDELEMAVVGWAPSHLNNSMS